MTPVQTGSPTFAVAGWAVQHRGDRAEQQDRVAILGGRRAPRCVLALLADGVGGRSGGALASEQAMATARRRFDEHGPDDPADRFLQDLVAEIHVVLHLAGTTAALEPHSTLAAVMVQPRRVDWCHVGDSRVYHVRDGRVRGRTVDDTVVERAPRVRGADATRAALHRRPGLLTQALGGAHAPVPHLGALLEPRVGDAFVLCSDGAWSLLHDAEIGAAASAASPRDALGALVATARGRAAGRADNCSMVMLRVEPAAG